MGSGTVAEQDRSLLLHAGTRASMSPVLTVFLRREGKQRMELLHSPHLEMFKFSFKEEKWNKIQNH